MRQGIIFSALVLLLAGCRKDDSPVPADLGYAYFPLIPGSSWLFKADSIVFNDFTGETDSSSFFLKETISETFEDLEGRTSYRLERHKSRYDTLSWQLADVWYYTRTTTALESVEEDLRYIRLIFPPRKGANWDANEMNTLPELIYEVDAWTGYTSPSGNVYDSTVIIKSTDPGNLIEIVSHEWIFARHVGPVKKTITDLKTEVNGSIKSGYIYNQVLIRFTP